MQNNKGVDLRNKTILITGGTGSFGQRFVERALDRNPKKIIVFSRDEHKQVEMSRRIQDPEKRVRFFIGDVRDKARLYRAFVGVDIVVHAAALKHVPVCEYNPFEAIQTNIQGAQNIIEAAIDREVEKILGISSDKACNPINLYGATKLCSDKLFVAANAYAGGMGTAFSLIRYGNFAESRGSVIPYFRELAKRGIREFPITDSRMTRFYITIDKAVDLAFEALKTMKGGEIFSPRMPSFSIIAAAKAVDPDAELVKTGKREAEKIHEDLIVNDDAHRTYEYKHYYITYPTWWDEDKVARGGRKVNGDFAYSSDRNDQWLKADELS